MIQSWNKFCFTGGVLELSIQLPGGHADAGGIVTISELRFIDIDPGLWPAAWLMGNLARATFKETTMVFQRRMSPIISDMVGNLAMEL